MRLKYVWLVGVLALFSVSARAQTPITIQASQTSGITSTTVTRNTFTIPANTYTAEILINITAGGTATGNLNIFIEDSLDGGTTWDDVVSSGTFALGAAAITQKFFVNGMLATSATQGAVAAAETLAAASVRAGPFGSLMRVREKISGASGSPVGATYTITATFKQ